MTPHRTGRWREGDIDPECSERNPWMDEWNGNCCRFPKSCSPRMNQARADALNGERWRVSGWCTEAGAWAEWLAHGSDPTTAQFFPSWREAFAYADAMARATT